MGTLLEGCVKCQPGKDIWGHFLCIIHSLPINASPNKKTVPKKVKNLLKTAISGGCQSHRRNGEQAFYRRVKVLEPLCNQEKTSRDLFFAKYTCFANEYESQ